MDSFVLLAYASLAVSRTLSQQLLAWLKFTLDSEYLFCWYKQMISMTYGSSRSCRKPWRWLRLNLILTMRDIYISSNLNSLTKFTSSSRSTDFKDIIPWNMMTMKMNCFCGMADQQKAFHLISSQDHCQRSSPSRISNIPQAGFEPVQNLSSGLVEWSCAAVITTTPQQIRPSQSARE